MSRSWLSPGQGLSEVPSLASAGLGGLGNGPRKHRTCSLSRVSVRCHLHEAHDGRHTHVFLSKVDKVLKVNIIPVGFDIVVDEEIKLVSDPVLEDKGQDPRRQLQEEDEAKEHGELGWGAHRWRVLERHGICGQGRTPTTSAARLHPLSLKCCPPPSPAGCVPPLG